VTTGLAQEHSRAPGHSKSVKRQFLRLGPVATMILAASALICACGGSADGLTKQQAVTMATTRAQQLSSVPVTFVSAASGRLGGFDTGDSNPDQQVWAVTFDGTFMPPSCGPSGPTPQQCLSPNGSLRIFLDYSSGAFVIGEEPAPGP
jgi:hypothetical protein